MKEILKGLDRDVGLLMREIGVYADSREISARLVGGIVRDTFLGRKSRDMDIVIEGNAVDFAQRWAKEKGLLIKVHPRFGTATVFVNSALYVDFVTARKETYPVQGALPQVKPSTFEDDVVRRDFTINALAVKLNRKEYGRIVDGCQGWEDLQNKVIRVFHEESFADDPTRVLRAIRFEQRFGFHLERSTLRILKEALKKGLDFSVSRPRYFTEFRRFFSEKNPWKCLNRLEGLGGDAFLKTLEYDADFLYGLHLRVSQMKTKISGFEHWSMLYILGLFWKLPSGRLEDRANSFQLCKAEKALIRQLPALEKVVSRSGLKRGEEFLKAMDQFSNEIIFFVRAANLSTITSSAWKSYLTRRRGEEL